LHPDVKCVLLNRDQIRERVSEIGAQIAADYYGEEVVFVGILKGAVVFFADLIRAVDLDMAIDFMAISSYGSATKSAGVVRIAKDLDYDVVGKHVIIVEDIVDSGLTLSFLKDNLLSRGSRTLKICALLDKRERRKIDIYVDYAGFVIPDEFVVGYGLDFAGRYRNLSDICCLKPEIYTND